MAIRISSATVHAVRFPTSVSLDGSDAMVPDTDYSDSYGILQTSVGGLESHGFTFTVGRGNELCVAAIDALAPLMVGKTLEEIQADPAQSWRNLVDDPQLRWLGPEKGVIHLAAAALINACWDLWAKAEGKPLWRLIFDMSPEQLVACLDFRYVEDVLTADEALGALREARVGREARLDRVVHDGYPAYTMSAGWLGYSEARIRSLCRAARGEGWDAFKVKVGTDVQSDRRRLEIVREEIGWKTRLMIDANQVWGVEEAISTVRELADFDLWWIEEPTNPDDVLGHQRIRAEVKPVKVATGEHCHNRIMFKQLFQADAIDVCQLDACRLAGVNEALVVLLLAAKFDVPVCPHAGGVGLCELVQHLAIVDLLVVSCF